MLPRWEVRRNYPEPPKSSKGMSSSHRRAPTPRIPGRCPRPFARHSRWSRITMSLLPFRAWFLVCEVYGAPGVPSERGKLDTRVVHRLRVPRQRGGDSREALGLLSYRSWWCTTHDPKRYGDALSQRKGCSIHTQLRGLPPLGLLGIRARHSSK